MTRRLALFPVFLWMAEALNTQNQLACFEPPPPWPFLNKHHVRPFNRTVNGPLEALNRRNFSANRLNRKNEFHALPSRDNTQIVKFGGSGTVFPIRQQEKILRVTVPQRA